MSTSGGPNHTKMSKVVEALCYFLKNIPKTSQYKIMSYGSKCDFLTLNDEEYEGDGVVSSRSTFMAGNE